MTLGEFIACGRQAEVFAWNDGSEPPRVIKLFLEQWGRQTVQWELDVARAVSASLSSAPRVFGDIVECDGRLGILYERVDGVPMLDVLSAKPWRVRSLGRRLARAQAQLHQSRPQDVPRLKDRLARKIGRTELLSGDEQAGCMRLLESMPDGDRLYHGDFHPGNILLRPDDQDSAVVIDWPNSAVGDPLADVAQTRMIIGIGWRQLSRRKDRILARLLTGYLNRLYTGHYLRLTGADRSGVRRWNTVIAAARLDDNIPQEVPYLREMVKAGLRQA